MLVASNQEDVVVCVVLSESEERKLRHIEAELDAHDSQFARTINRLTACRPGGRWARRGYFVVISLAIGEAALCLALSGAGAAPAAVPAIALAAATMWARRDRFPRARRINRCRIP